MRPKPLKRESRKTQSNRPFPLGPDGVEFIVDWDSFGVGMSLFVPCLDSQQCLNEFNSIADRKDWMFDYAVRIENGKIGVRFWRIA